MKKIKYTVEILINNCIMRYSVCGASLFILKKIATSFSATHPFLYEKSCTVNLNIKVKNFFYLYEN